MLESELKGFTFHCTAVKTLSEPVQMFNSYYFLIQPDKELNQFTIFKSTFLGGAGGWVAKMLHSNTCFHLKLNFVGKNMPIILMVDTIWDYR